MVHVITPDRETLDSLVADRVAWLSAYQDAAWAARYEALVRRVAAVEREKTGMAGALAEAGGARVREADVVQGRIRGRAAC